MVVRTITKMYITFFKFLFKYNQLFLLCSNMDNDKVDDN